MFWPRSIVIGTAIVVSGRMPPVFAATWTEMYVPYNNSSDMDSDSFGDFGRYDLNDPLRQHLHLLQAPSSDETPTPVYFYAHANGGKASSIEEHELDIFVHTGYSVISWESVSHLSSLEDVEACWSDFDLVWSWFRDNAVNYGFDSESVVIGGRSRGTVCSWPMAQSSKPQIKGIYMYNALPNSVWEEEANNSFWLDSITQESPPAHLVYGPECPKPISEDCDPNDGHNPRNGQRVVDKYTELGIGSKIELTDGLTNDGIGIYDLFPNSSFVLPLVAPPSSSCSLRLSELCPAYATRTMKACANCARSNEDTLFDAGCTAKEVTKLCTPPPPSSACSIKLSELCPAYATRAMKACANCARSNEGTLFDAGCTAEKVTELCTSVNDAPSTLSATPSAPPSEDNGPAFAAESQSAASGCWDSFRVSAYLCGATLTCFVALLVQ